MTNKELLRQWMAARHVEALVVPIMDPHNTEYVAEHWQCLRWLTGFTGSAGTAVLTADQALMWTDSRYWLQAEKQLQASAFGLKRDLVDETVNQWLRDNVKGTTRYPADMMTNELRQTLFDGVEAEPLTEDPFDELWTDRPALPLSMAERMPDELAGETAQSKLARLVEWLVSQGREQILVTDLSEIAWTLNLRGDDIPYNPFIISFLMVRASGRHTLYVNHQQLNAETSTFLAEMSVDIEPYVQAPRGMDERTPISDWRAVKNEVEQRGFVEAHKRDGVAMVQFLRRVDEAVADGSIAQWTEMHADRVLTALRAQQPGFRGLSFATIAGYGPNGAVVHYEPTPETDTPLRAESFLLLDSGGHYDCGSTDITRTIPLGELTDEERRVYTLVLRGHLQLQNMVFPRGTTGLQLDTAARMPLWRAGYDYGHGTGHGVGHRLGIHEGPAQIRKNLRPDTIVPIRQGQNMTCEPGVYVTGRFGVRHENTMLCVSADLGQEFGDFLRFVPLTLCPYDLRPLLTEMLTPEERGWLNDYHAKVRATLTPLLPDEKDREWLAHATRAV